MSLHLLNPRACIITAAFMLLLFAGLAICSDAGKQADNPVVNSSADANEPNGPTVTLSYTSKTNKENPFASFMYLVPLVSPDTVDVVVSADNDQKVAAVSYEKKISPKSFYVNFEFKMLGNGFHKYTFDAPGVIAKHSGPLKAGETLTHTIDYIKFEGPGLCRIEVKGTIAGSVKTVTEVDLRFIAGDLKSPVTIGLYDVKPKDGQYKYENRTGELVARVDSFIFKKTDGEPEMGIKLTSVNAASNPDGMFAGLKGLLANFFMEPPKVSKLGNDTMLNFGLALLDEKPLFTFPKAKNIRETRTVKTNNP
jgi:hypothetical protein